MKVCLSQINPTVGDFSGNLSKIITSIDVARREGCSLVIFPEMVICGYPPMDLLFEFQFISSSKEILSEIVNYALDVDVIVGLPWWQDNRLYNAAVWISKGKICGVYKKWLLPNYGEFDEKRYFAQGKDICLWEISGRKFLMTICEDVWDLESGPVGEAKRKDIDYDYIINISASPFYKGKIFQRIDVLKKAADFSDKRLIYVNLVGGQDELVFDGGSGIFDKDGILYLSKRFEEDVAVVDLDSFGRKTYVEIAEDEILEVWKAIVLGCRDYVDKNGFEKVVIGLSGGIDSSLCLAVAVESVGKERIICVSMPSRFNSNETKEDVKKLTSNFGVKCIWIGIDKIFDVILDSLSPIFKGTEFGIAEENIQARIRGLLLMAIANKFGYLVLTTGNKSEMSVGYATLYGDMAGGYAVLKDVPKTLVWQLSRFYNKMKGKELIPESIILRPPSAELRYNQKDEDALLPYDILDKIICRYVEDGWTAKKILEKECIDKEAVERIIKLLWKAEYKRRQAPVGVKITKRAFGKEWRMPITNKFRGGI